MEVVAGVTTGDYGNRVVGEGEALRRRQGPLQLRIQLSLARQALCLAQHLRRKVSGDDTSGIGRHHERREAGSRAQIQHRVAAGGRCQATHRLQALAATVQAALGVTLGLARVLILGIVRARTAPFEAHGARSSRAGMTSERRRK